MKNVLLIFLCLFGYLSASAQIQLKGFLGNQTYYDNYVINIDSFYKTRNEIGMNIHPSLAIAFYRIDRTFHEIAISDIRLNSKNEEVRNPLTGSVQTNTGYFRFYFQYNYNFCLLKNPKRWNPYIGLQTQHRFMSSSSEQNNNSYRTTTFSSIMGFVAGLQYKLKENLRLEFQLPINLATLTYHRQKLVRSTIPNGNVRQALRFNWNPQHFKSILFRIGIAVQI